MQGRMIASFCQQDHEKYKGRPGYEDLADVESCIARYKGELASGEADAQAAGRRREREEDALQAAPCKISPENC